MAPQEGCQAGVSRPLQRGSASAGTAGVAEPLYLFSELVFPDISRIFL